jgi:hypothetical protein
MFDTDARPVAQPVARRGEEQSQRLGPAVAVHVPVWHEQAAQLLEEVAVGGIVGR